MTPGSEGRGGTVGPAAARAAALAFIPPAGGDPALAEALRQAQPGEPARVDRLDERGAGYYLVPFYVDGRVRAIVIVDARTGEVGQAGVIRDEKAAFLLSREEALEAVRRGAPDLTDLTKPRLVWRPCPESYDPVLPFWAIQHAGGRVYVTQSGAVHARLSVAGLGGEA